MAKRKDSKNKKGLPKIRSVKLKRLLSIDWKIPLAFLLGVAITILGYTLAGMDLNFGNSTTPGAPLDAHVNLYVLADASCQICDESWIAERVGVDFFNVTTTVIDINSAQGQTYKNLLGITSVPAAFFDASVEDAGNFTTYENNYWIIPSQGYYLLNIQGEKDLTRTATSTPTLDLFVMSHCPYGTAAETTMNSVLSTISGFDFNLHFIANVYTAAEYAALPEQTRTYYTTYSMCTQKNDTKYYCSLHGPTEVEGDVAQLCAMKYHNDSWFNFTLAYNNANFDTNAAIAAMGYDATVMSNCINSSEGWNLFADDIALAEELSIGSSPTYFFDNVIRGSSSSVGVYGPAGVLCILHPTTLTGCSQAGTVQSAQATGSC